MRAWHHPPRSAAEDLHLSNPCGAFIPGRGIMPATPQQEPRLRTRSRSPDREPRRD